MCLRALQGYTMEVLRRQGFILLCTKFVYTYKYIYVDVCTKGFDTKHHSYPTCLHFIFLYPHMCIFIYSIKCTQSLLICRKMYAWHQVLHPRCVYKQHVCDFQLKLENGIVCCWFSCCYCCC